MTQQQSLTPGLLEQIEALTQGFNQNARLGNLSPELLAFLAGQRGETANGGLLRGFTLPDGRRISQYGQFAIADPNAGPEAQAVSTDPNRVNWNAGPIDFMLNTDLSNRAAMFDPATGQFMGYEQREDGSSWKQWLQAAAMILGGYYGGTYLSEAAAGAGAGGTATGVGGGTGAGGGAGGTGAAGAAGTSSITLPTTAEMAAGMTPASASTAAASMPVINTAATTAGTAAGTSAATKAGTSAATSAVTQGGGQSSTTGVSDFRQGEIGSYQSDPNAITKPATVGGNMTDFDRWWEGVKQAVGAGAGSDPASWANLASNFLGNNAGGLLGAYLGYKDSKDKQETQNREPWKPLQPHLLGLANEGAALFNKYQTQPFSPAQQAAYGNFGSVLDVINQNAGGLLSGFQATGGGKNQFQRGKPGLLTGYSFAPTGEQWQPGLLGNFGTGGTGLLRR